MPFLSSHEGVALFQLKNLPVFHGRLVDVKNLMKDSMLGKVIYLLAKTTGFRIRYKWSPQVRPSVAVPAIFPQAFHRKVRKP